MEASRRMPAVLVVDDEQANLATFRRVFRQDFDMYLATSAEEALEHMAERAFDVALVDFAMPGMNGVEFFREAATRRPTMDRILVTAHADLPEVRAAKASGL